MVLGKAVKVGGGLNDWTPKTSLALGQVVFDVHSSNTTSSKTVGDRRHPEKCLGITVNVAKEKTVCF